jgi:hypothetical protein
MSFVRAPKSQSSTLHLLLAPVPTLFPPSERAMLLRKRMTWQMMQNLEKTEQPVVTAEVQKQQQ